MGGMPVMPPRPDSQQGGTLMDCLTEEQLADAPDRFFCPISMEVMVQPVKLATTGQVFDHLSLLKWFRAGGRNCPMTGVHLSGTVTLQADVALRDEISAWLHAQGKDPDAFRRASLVAWRDADLSGKKGSTRQSRQRRRPHRGAVLSALLNFLTARTYARVYAQIY